MQKIFLKFSSLTFVLSLLFNTCNATIVKGYIINLNQDTIFGTINLNKFNQATGSFYFSGFDLEGLSFNVSFKDNSEKNYQTYTPKTISGFGFVHKATVYEYKSFALKHSNIFKKENTAYRFLNLIYRGCIDLYKDESTLTTYAGSSNASGNPITYDYYLFSQTTGLIKVEKTKQVKTVKDLLRMVGFNETFIQKVPENAKFKNIKAILEEYNNWKSAQNNTLIDI